jgi:hypothetical protein
LCRQSAKRTKVVNGTVIPSESRGIPMRKL